MRNPRPKATAKTVLSTDCILRVIVSYPMIL
jgi:hypothetical protein